MPTLASKDLCVGCTACVSKCPNHCLDIVYDEAGFAYPRLINVEKCKHCNLCENACPILNKVKIQNEVTRAFAACSCNDKIRLESSSGGVFTEIAVQVLSNGGLVYGAVYNDNWVIKHIAIDSIEKLQKLRGAKYAESRLEGIFSNIEMQLNNEKEILFSGTPCQVAGLKSFLKRDYSNLLCIDFVCHSIPSPMVWRKYIERRKQSDAEVEMPIRVNQRSKETGWSKYSYSCVIEYPDGKKYSSKSSNDIYMRLFCNDYISRKSCETCAFKGYNRFSDITLGDFWGIWDFYPEMDDNKGTSLVLLHSQKGKKLFESLSDKIKVQEVSLDQASQMNPSILKSALHHPDREVVLETIEKYGFGAALHFIEPKNNSNGAFLKKIRQHVNKKFKGEKAKRRLK